MCLPLPSPTAGSQDGTVHVWSADTETRRESLCWMGGGGGGTQAPPTVCSFNPKLMMMASACTSMVSLSLVTEIHRSTYNILSLKVVIMRLNCHVQAFFVWCPIVFLMASVLGTCVVTVTQYTHATNSSNILMVQNYKGL